MSRCRHCGAPIEFRTIDGQRTPMHFEEHCTADPYGFGPQISRSPESSCMRTRCPTCGDDVYFIRHNGGSVFIDPPLGPPWWRHDCMTEPEGRGAGTGGRSKSAIGPAIGELLAKVRDLVTGVVVQTEPVTAGRQMVVTIAVAQPENLVLVVDGDASRSLGRIVVLCPPKRLLYLAENPDVTLKVDRARFIPPAFINKDYPLLTPKGQTPAPVAPLKPSAVSLALKKYRTQGLRGEWKIEQLLALINVFSHDQRNEVAHFAAMLILEEVASDGNCTPAGAFCSAMPVEFKTDLAEWFRTFSPIEIELHRSGVEAHFEDALGGERQLFQIEEARKKPFFRFNPRRRLSGGST